jgi:hypothetical protein
MLSSEVGVQTESIAITVSQTVQTFGHQKAEDDQESTLSAADLASILKWSKEISRDINLSSGKLSANSFGAKANRLGVALQRLTEIVTGEAG